jgi:hypothetical protein
MTSDCPTSPRVYQCSTSCMLHKIAFCMSPVTLTAPATNSQASTFDTDPGFVMAAQQWLSPHLSTDTLMEATLSTFSSSRAANWRACSCELWCTNQNACRPLLPSWDTVSLEERYCRIRERPVTSSTSWAGELGNVATLSLHFFRSAGDLIPRLDNQDNCFAVAMLHGMCTCVNLSG